MPALFFVVVTRTGARKRAGSREAQDAANDTLFRRCAPYAHGAPRRSASCAFHPQIPFIGYNTDGGGQTPAAVRVFSV